MNRIAILTFAIALISINEAYNQQAYKLTINQLPPLIVTVPEEINAKVGALVNLDTLYVVEGDVPHDRVWKFWDGLVLESIDNPVYEISSNGVLYLTVLNGDGCTDIDSIQVNIVTADDYIRSDPDFKKSIRIIPNPNTGEFNVILNDCQPGYYLQLINSLGIEVYSMILECTGNEYQGMIRLHAFESGIYFLMVKHDDIIIHSEKVSILR